MGGNDAVSSRFRRGSRGEEDKNGEDKIIVGSSLVDFDVLGPQGRGRKQKEKKKREETENRNGERQEERK